MKTFIALAATLVSLTFAGAAVAEPTQCSSNFCAGNSSGANCRIGTKTYTCGNCSGQPNGVLYVGDLDADTATGKCERQHNKRTVRTPKAKKTTRAKARRGN